MSSSIFSRLSAILAIGLLAAGSAGAADTVLASKHDLSIAGGGAIKATREAEVCLFCHTPHRGTGDTPLWNHAMSQASYTPYSSTSIRSEIGQPTGASKLCLSCHDGTVALGMVHSRSTPIELQSGVTTMPAGRSNLGTDLSDDHPVSFKYDSALASTRGDLKDPATLVNEVKLDHNSDMQCTSCHDPHSNQYGKFLVRDNTASGLCVQCHAPPGWENSVHRMSNKNWNGSGVDPWPFSEELTVSANACASCHVSHGAGTPQRLLTHADEERNCFSCHNGNVATKNVETDFNKFSVHPIFDNTGIHQPLEDVVNPPRHVECADCHDPHASQTLAATAPNASGALTGVRGVNSAGAIANAVQYEYELCYRCHADSANKGPARVNRQFPQTNTRIEFDSSNQSYHPVEVPSRNGTSVSLLAPWTASSRMYCTDCHNSDQAPAVGGSGANGPHGSMYPPILERQLITTDRVTENAGTYSLCYKCHSRSSILGDQSFRYHKKHIVDIRTACTTCHDSHGVPNVKHLINFNPDYVTPAAGRVEYQSTGFRSGNCTLNCHGEEHINESYDPF